MTQTEVATNHVPYGLIIKRVSKENVNIPGASGWKLFFFIDLLKGSQV